MTTLHGAAMRQALEALEESQKYVDASANAKLLEGWGEQLDRAEAAIQALRTELARVQEPASGYKVVPPNASGETNCTVRWMIETDLGWVGAYDKEVLTNLLAATPQAPERKPLTDEQIEDLARGRSSHVEFARALERVHGIVD